MVNSLLKDAAAPQALQQHAEVPLFLVFNGGQLGLPLALIKGFFDPEGRAGALDVLRDPPASEELTWGGDGRRLASASAKKYDPHCSNQQSDCG